MGSAAEAGVDRFCRDTLAGDWLEVIGLWQTKQAPYTPHPDFWVGALWSKLMGVRVLGTTVTSTWSASNDGGIGTAEAASPLRAFSHCSKLTPGAVVFAVSVAGCSRNSSLFLHFPGALHVTTYLLSTQDPASDYVALNSEPLMVTPGSPVPSLDGVRHSGDMAEIPKQECAVGFVEAQYAAPVPACAA